MPLLSTGLIKRSTLSVVLMGKDTIQVVLLFNESALQTVMKFAR